MTFETPARRIHIWWTCNCSLGRGLRSSREHKTHAQLSTHASRLPKLTLYNSHVAIDSRLLSAQCNGAKPEETRTGSQEPNLHCMVRTPHAEIVLRYSTDLTITRLSLLRTTMPTARRTVPSSRHEGTNQDTRTLTERQRAATQRNPTTAKQCRRQTLQSSTAWGTRHIRETFTIANTVLLVARWIIPTTHVNVRRQHNHFMSVNQASQFLCIKSYTRDILGVAAE